MRGHSYKVLQSRDEIGGPLTVTVEIEEVVSGFARIIHVAHSNA
jgi:hypothetical protein